MERRDARGDIYNAAEAAAVVSHVRTLLRAGVAPSSVAVLSPYTAQVALLKRALLEAAESANQPLASIEVATVDSFQGRESDAVVLSLVRSNRRGAVGFLADRRRLNVAVTRARRHLALVCDAAMLGSSDEAPVELKSLLTRGEREGFWVEAASPGQRAVAQGVIVPAVGSSVQPSV
jgi:superfamily I DNA and/or RNA helicase